MDIEGYGWLPLINKRKEVIRQTNVRYLSISVIKISVFVKQRLKEKEDCTAGVQGLFWDRNMDAHCFISLS